MYVISRSEVLHIEYKGGQVDVINKNPQTVVPQSSTPSAGEPKEAKKAKPIDLYYINKNAVLINGLALTNADITLMYERDFAKNHLSVTFLGGYNFNKRTTWPNLYLAAGLENTKKNYDLGLGINFYPGVSRKSQYFVGIMVKYMTYSFDREIITEQIINGFAYPKIDIEKAQGYQLATMIVNGFQVRLTPSVTYKAFVGIGPFSSDDDLKQGLQNNIGTGGLLKMYLGICFGYRF